MVVNAPLLKRLCLHLVPVAVGEGVIDVGDL